MRNESATSSTHATTSTNVRGSVKTDPAHGQEDVQRFRKLMDGKPSGRKSDAQQEDVGDVPDDQAGQAGQAANGSAGKLSQEQQKALYALLQQQLGAAEGKAVLLARDDAGDDDGDEQPDDSHGDAAGANLSMPLCQQSSQPIQYAQQQPTVASQVTLTPALAELIERHVKQMLVPDAASRSSAQSREIMLTLKNGLLPDTELWLSRTPTGWHLRANTHSADAYRSLVDSAPQLIERFADSRLGELEVEPSLLD